MIRVAAEGSGVGDQKASLVLSLVTEGQKSQGQDPVEGQGPAHSCRAFSNVPLYVFVAQGGFISPF